MCVRILTSICYPLKESTQNRLNKCQVVAVRIYCLNSSTSSTIDHLKCFPILSQAQTIDKRIDCIIETVYRAENQQEKSSVQNLQP